MIVHGKVLYKLGGIGDEMLPRCPAGLLPKEESDLWTCSSKMTWEVGECELLPRDPAGQAQPSENGYYRGGALSTVASSETQGPVLIHKSNRIQIFLIFTLRNQCKVLSLPNL